MEHIKIKLKAKETESLKLPILNFRQMYEYWMGSMALIPVTLKNMEFSDYENNKCLTWYDRQKLHHDKVMEEFKNLFKWQKK